MKAAIHAAGVLILSGGIALAHASFAGSKPTHAPSSQAPETPARWHSPPPNAATGASAPRGNLRDDIESNARWNGNRTDHRPPPRH